MDKLSCRFKQRLNVLSVPFCELGQRFHNPHERVRVGRGAFPCRRQGALQVDSNPVSERAADVNAEDERHAGTGAFATALPVASSRAETRRSASRWISRI